MMRRSSVVIFSLCFFIVLVFAYSAQAQTWKDLMGQADSLSEAGNLDSAIVIANEALERVERQFGERGGRP